MGVNWTIHEDTILKLAHELNLTPGQISDKFLPERSPDAIMRRLKAVRKPTVPYVSRLKRQPALATPMDAETANLASRCDGLNAAMWTYYNKRAKAAKCTPLEAAVLFCGMRA